MLNLEKIVILVESYCIHNVRLMNKHTHARWMRLFYSFHSILWQELKRVSNISYKPERQNLLNNSLAQIMVHPVQLLFCVVFMYMFIQFQGTG